MGHGNGEEAFCHSVPFIDGLVVLITPSEDKLAIETTVFITVLTPGIGKIPGFLRRHAHENLHEREESLENMLIGVELNLVQCVRPWHA